MIKCYSSPWVSALKRINSLYNLSAKFQIEICVVQECFRLESQRKYMCREREVFFVEATAAIKSINNLDKLFSESPEWKEVTINMFEFTK